MRPGERLLDLGVGVGGPARTLAAERGCEVVGADLTEEYLHLAGELTERAGPRGRARFVCADSRELPFRDAAFDVVWSQHATMNVPEARELLAAARRVLRPGGRLVLHEVCAGPEAPPHFPVPWAGEPSISHLVAPDALRASSPGSASSSSSGAT